MNRYIYYILCWTMLLGACRSDDFKETVVEETPTDTGQLDSGDINGLVIDNAGEGIQEATVTLNGKTRITDSNGYFKFEDIEVDVAGAVVKISKANYFDGFKFVHTEKGTQSYVKVTMVEAKETGRFQSTDIGAITETSGAGILFPANSISKNGSAYNGEVIVKSHWYDPADQALGASMPGDLRAINASEEIVQLATLGMMAVELSAPDGTELQLTDGKTATLTFPLTPELVSEVTSDVPLWSLNENTGVWEEEGVATLVGDRMVGEVSHFSFWNCDYPYELVEISGKLGSLAGDPLPNFLVSIKVKNTILTGTGTTNSKGEFKGKVPKDEPLELSVFYCNEELIKEDLGILSTDTEVGPYYVNSTDFEKRITGRLLKCGGTPLVDGYLLVRAGNGIQLMAPNSQGEISGVIIGCGEVTLKAIDALARAESEVIEVENNNDPLELGDIELCGEISERILYTINGGVPNVLEDARVSLINNEFVHLETADGLNNEFFDIRFSLNGPGSVAPFQIALKGFNENNESTYRSCGSVYKGSGVVCEDLEVTITELGSIEGSWVRGTVKGFIPQDTFSNSDVELNADFQFQLDESFDTGRLEGKVWNDVNENGIREAGEAPISGISFNLYGPPDLVEFPRYYPETNDGRTSNADGDYYIDGLVPEEYYTVTWFERNHYDVTIAGQGDETVDCDFELAAGTSNKYDYIIQSFTDSGLEDNIDLGLIPVKLTGSLSSWGCGDEVFVQVFPRGGVPPYEITMDGVTTLPLGDTRFENVSEGDHLVTVKDQSGLEWLGDITIYTYRNIILGKAWLDEPGGEEGVLDDSDSVFPSTLVHLLDLDDMLIAGEVTEGATGQYNFYDVKPGVYKVETNATSQYELVEKAVGSDDTKDSDIDPATGYSDEITLSGCDQRITIDIGYREL